MVDQNACHGALERSAITPVLAGWRRDFPECGVLALVAESEKDRVGVLQEVAGELGVPLVGAIFPALIKDGELIKDGVWLLRLATMPPYFLVDDLGHDEAAKVAELAASVAQAAAAAGAEAPTLFMVFDAMVPNIGPILDELYLQLADSVAYAGVNAGSETFQPMPCLFDGQRTVQGGVLGLLLDGASRPVLHHGYPIPQQVMTATSAEANCVKSIDWRPAFAVYRELIDREYGVSLTPENFYQHACHFPLGILRANEEVIVRIPVGLREDGAVFCVGDVPANSMLVLLQAPPAGAGGGIPALAASLRQVNGDLAGRSLLTFYCAGRRMHMGDAAPGELTALSTDTACAAVVGALSLGEIGSAHAWDYPLFHNAALVCLPWEK